MNAPAVGGGQVCLPFIQNIAPRFVLLNVFCFYNVFLKQFSLDKTLLHLTLVRDKSLNMDDGEVVKHVDNSEDAAMRVEGEEADGDENVD